MIDWMRKWGLVEEVFHCEMSEDDEKLEYLRRRMSWTAMVPCACNIGAMFVNVLYHLCKLSVGFNLKHSQLVTSSKH